MYASGARLVKDPRDGGMTKGDALVKTQCDQTNVTLILQVLVCAFYPSYFNFEITKISNKHKTNILIPFRFLFSNATKAAILMIDLSTVMLKKSGVYHM